MDRYRYFLAGLSLIITSFLGAQQVVSTGGDYFETNNGSISFTIGEVVIETIENGDNCLTQGFQQSTLNVFTILDEKPTGKRWIVYPNPTNDYVKLRIPDYEGLRYQLCTYRGKIIKEGKIENTETLFSFIDYPLAAFLIRVIDNNRFIKVFKVIKQ
ncbi:MAG: hypothetical protein GXO86_12865 [Chlorobi bacterium]|nr:hypothetical protein [Chlorobiota bacterium]